METVISTKLPLSKLAEPVTMFPQVLKNLRVSDKAAVRNNPAVQAALRKAAEEIGDTGRILLRESGTEPVVRVMAEAPTERFCEEKVNAVVDVIHAQGLA